VKFPIIEMGNLTVALRAACSTKRSGSGPWTDNGDYRNPHFGFLASQPTFIRMLKSGKRHCQSVFS